jgi:hypothetical protein
MKVQ